MQISREILKGKGILSDLVLSRAITDLDSLLEYLKNLPYGRSSVRGQLELVLVESKGTCSSKHALLASIAVEQGWDEIALILCVYKMHKRNTPGIRDILDDQPIAYLPEAHCYIKIGEHSVDITSAEADLGRIKSDILAEQIISPKQVGEWKVKYHKDYIKNWIIEREVILDFDYIWALRESAIRNLET